jgi:hypothetical protein
MDSRGSNHAILMADQAAQAHDPPCSSHQADFGLHKQCEYSANTVRTQCKYNGKKSANTVRIQCLG